MSANQITSERNTAGPDSCTYTIEIRGRIEEADLEMMCPPGLVILRRGPDGMAFSIETDQSGLLGLLRHLHSRGVVFEEIKRSSPLPSREGVGG